MKTLFAILLTLTLAVPVLALQDDGVDSFGIYFDETGDTVAMDGVAPSTVVDAYFILAHPSAGSVQGWEIFVDYDGLLPLDVEYYGMNPLDIYAAEMDRFAVGLAFPLPGGEMVTLAHVQLLCQDENPHLLQAGPCVPASIEGVPAYVRGGDLELFPMTFSTVTGPQDLTPEGWTINGLAAVNGEGPIATESESWSSLKALFE